MSCCDISQSIRDRPTTRDDMDRQTALAVAGSQTEQLFAGWPEDWQALPAGGLLRM